MNCVCPRCGTLSNPGEFCQECHEYVQTQRRLRIMSAMNLHKTHRKGAGRTDRMLDSAGKEPGHKRSAFEGRS